MAPPFGMILRAIAAGPPGMRGGRCRCPSHSPGTAPTKATVESVNNKLPSKPVLQYFDLGNLAGRGGYIRFWLLANGIDFSEELVSFGDWMDVKASLLKSGDNPAGHLPVVRMGDATLVEHVAIMRFLSRQVGAYGADQLRDYEVDAVADEYMSWVSAWAATVVHPPDGLVAEYRGSRAWWYTLFEALYAKRSHQEGPFFAPSPTFVDCCVFGLIRDDQILHGAANLPAHPHLRELVDGMMAVPAVRAWITAADLAAASKLEQQASLAD